VPVVLTVGHSTRTLHELVQLLQLHGVRLLVDVRSIPASRRMPHFAKAALERSLPEHSIEYIHMPALGGLRKPAPGSVNAGWRNEGFRGYADHMQTDAFWRAIAELEALAKAHRTAVMCAEALPWRCHRSLLSDALTVEGVEVRHIVGPVEPALHALTPFAVIEGGRITYPPPDTLPL
jgi:uncharacterized protein (DUF488 family)